MLGNLAGGARAPGETSRKRGFLSMMIMCSRSAKSYCCVASGAHPTDVIPGRPGRIAQGAVLASRTRNPEK
jgi:hypothetical protein